MENEVVNTSVDDAGSVSESSVNEGDAHTGAAVPNEAGSDGNGDVDYKALSNELFENNKLLVKQLQNAQQTIGRQGDELGKFRKQPDENENDDDEFFDGNTKKALDRYISKQFNKLANAENLQPAVSQVLKQDKEATRKSEFEKEFNSIMKNYDLKNLTPYDIGMYATVNGMESLTEAVTRMESLGMVAKKAGKNSSNKQVDLNKAPLGRPNIPGSGNGDKVNDMLKMSLDDYAKIPENERLAFLMEM